VKDIIIFLKKRIQEIDKSTIAKLEKELKLKDDKKLEVELLKVALEQEKIKQENKKLDQHREI